MTYAAFLAVFVLPPALVQGVVAVRTARRGRGRSSLWRVGGTTLAMLVLVAWGWTMPWDSWIIQRGVWSYPPGRVAATLWHVPAEECLFMAGQTVVVGLWTLSLLHRTSRPAVRPRRPLADLSGPGFLAAAALAGPALVVAGEHGTYLGSMLVWFCPPLALQQAFGGPELRSMRRTRLRAALPAMMYLWTADRAGIGLGIWQISPKFTYGPDLLGLPVEEALFFTITCVLLVDGLVLATGPTGERAATVLRRIRPGNSGTDRTTHRPADSRHSPAP